MPEDLKGFPPANAEEVRITALMNVLYYARTENLEGLLSWSRLLVASGDLSPEDPPKVQEAIAQVIALSMGEVPPDPERLQEAFAAACRMLEVEPA